MPYFGQTQAAATSKAITSREWLANRKRLRKQAQRSHPGRPIQLVGGTFYFMDTKTPVPGIPSEETGRGWAAGFQPRTQLPRRERRANKYQAYNERDDTHSYSYRANYAW